MAGLYMNENIIGIICVGAILVLAIFIWESPFYKKQQLRREKRWAEMSWWQRYKKGLESFAVILIGVTGGLWALTRNWDWTIGFFVFAWMIWWVQYYYEKDRLK